MSEIAKEASMVNYNFPGQKIAETMSSFGLSPLRQKNFKECLAPISIMALIAAMGAMLVPIFFLRAEIASYEAPITQNSTSVSAETIFQLANNERLKSGLPTLVKNPKLSTAAQKKAISLVRENYFSHTTPQGKKFHEWIEEAGYEYGIVGENLAEEFSASEGVVKAWMQSKRHRENILNPAYLETGVAALPTEDARREVIVQIFGRRK